NIEKAGGKALPLVCDIRHEDQIVDAIKKTVSRFGGIDILVNNDALNDSGKFRTPEIMADAAYCILTKSSQSFTGNFVIDELILSQNGVTDFGKYAVKEGATEFEDDFFIDAKLKDQIYAVRAKSSKASKL
ncbi:hypothetical protein L0F63_001289, partial [Massospora cicadina]